MLKYTKLCVAFISLFTPVGVDKFASWTVEALVGVGTKEVALGLQKVCR